MPICYGLVNRPNPENTGDSHPLYPRVVCKGTAKTGDLLLAQGWTRQRSPAF